MLKHTILLLFLVSTNIFKRSHSGGNTIFYSGNTYTYSITKKKIKKVGATVHNTQYLRSCMFANDLLQPDTLT